MEKRYTRFSIIIVAYNVEQYIEEAIESVLNQDFRDYEIIVVDDCSTDNTAKKIQQYKDERIKVCSTKRNTITPGKPRNVGLENANGEYILFLDGDDKLYNNYVISYEKI